MNLLVNEYLKFFRLNKLLSVIGICVVLIFIAGNSTRGAQHATGANMITEWAWGLPSGLFLPILVAMICVDMVSSEVVKGTVKIILIRPVSRWSIWVSKWIIGIMASWVVLLVLALGLYVFVGFLNGFGSWSSPAYLDSKMLSESTGIFTLKAYGLQMLNLASMVTFILALSTFIDNVPFAFGITMFTIIGTLLLLLMGHHMGWEKYLFSVQWWLLPQILTGNPTIQCSLSLSLGIELSWMVVFFIVGITRFQLRDFT
jgi:ABC-2 type transport system permease protein